MVSMRNLALAASTMIGFTTAAPAMEARFTPGKINNTQEFYIAIDSTSLFQGLFLETYHTGAGLADPVFTNDLDARVASFLNGTHLQFDTGFTPFAANPYLGDTNYARWEPVTINGGYGTSDWVINADGLTLIDEEFGGWLVCEWFHGTNAPQLFTLIKGFDSPEGVYPSTCAKVLLRPEYF